MTTVAKPIVPPVKPPAILDPAVAEYLQREIAARLSDVHYVAIDGTTTPPRVISSTCASPVKVVRLLAGTYEVTFDRPYAFLVGTAVNEIPAGTEFVYTSMTLLAARGPDRPNTWVIETYDVSQEWGPDKPGQDWQRSDAQFNLIVRV